MSNATLQRLSAARTALVLDHPFFGALALKLEPVESTRTETMATDGRSLFYNASFVESMSDIELVGLYAHEVLHPAMLHHARREGREPGLWNEAADYAINPLVIEAGLTLPASALIDDQYQGLSAEQIYDRLPKPQPGGGQGPGPDPGPESPDPAQMPGAFFDAPEPAQDAADWQVAVKQAAQAAKMMGNAPASIVRMIEQETAPKVDWRSLLRRFVQQTAASDYSWKVPNRRYIASGIYLPELRGEQLPPIVVVVDTSGSIDEATLAAFKAEMRSIVDECNPEATHVIYADAAVKRVDVFPRGEPIEMNAEGGGGTSFCPAFEHVDAEQIEPACLIYLTDGAGRYPDAPASYPTLWAMTSTRVAPWGETLQIEGAIS
jgi:predicted metal-dependent peptidase